VDFIPPPPLPPSSGIGRGGGGGQGCIHQVHEAARKMVDPTATSLQHNYANIWTDHVCFKLCLAILCVCVDFVRSIKYG
jgi:hypothetical protein